MPSEPTFVDAYLRARGHEGRLLADDIVRMLPEVPDNDAHADEWRQRADSAARFRRYLAVIKRPIDVVDLGCGNGWFTARMAQLEHVTAIGIEMNTEELGQARRVFGNWPRLSFREGDIRCCDLGDRRPDVIVLASTLQYVADPRKLLSDLFESSGQGTEVHVLDTPIYGADDVAAARQRTREHYERIGVPEMSEHYHHHQWQIFEGHSMEMMYRPDSIVHRVERRVLKRPRAPFPWIRVTV